MESIKNFKVFKPKSKGLSDITNDFITIASHQLRTPITAVRWVLDIVLSGKLGELNEKQRRAIKLAYQNNLFMVRLVNDILRFSRLEDRGVVLAPKMINVRTLINKVIKKYQEYALASNCQINFSLAGKLNIAYIDPNHFRGIIDAMINNAITYSRLKGKINISLKQNGDFLILTIKDNGIGIALDQQSMIFTKFFRGKNAMKTQAGGLGLNLYVAQKICSASGGKIEFESKENVGTTFRLFLPTNKSLITDLLIHRQETPNELLKKEREFVNITIHELKAPLGITKWSLEMLLSERTGDLNKVQLDLIQRVYRGNERLLVLVRDLLNLAKLQEGKFSIVSEPLNIINISDVIITDFKPQAIKKKINLNWTKLTGKMPLINGDSSRLTQVITNLLSNAIKYTPENGEVTVKIEKITAEALKKISRSSEMIKILNTKNSKGYYVLSFTDNGIGISKEDQKKLFSRFFRSQKVLESKTEGTGLGLFITKSIVNMHNGDIWFTSIPGEGSTFYFSLPIN